VAPASTIVLSIAPRWVDLILSGQKTVELRRRGPKNVDGHRNIIIYATKPVCAIVAVGAVTGIIEGPPERLWREIGSSSGCTKKQFFDYFDGATSGAAMRLADVKSVPSISLSLLRRQLRWHPPVSWMNAGGDLIALVSRT
jgi:predicted transcriptional regulator